MTGPDYPHPYPVPGSNGIGVFQIGVSPIGVLSEFDPWITVISQYANSPILMGMILAFNNAMDQTENISNLYDMIWNIETAQGYGLDVWGRIVGVSRILKLPANTTFFGFNEPNSGWTGFGQAGFFSGEGSNSNFILSDDDFRKLIMAKAAGNISDGTIQSVNKILSGLFPNRGAAYVADGLNMSLTYTFAFPLNPVELAIVELSGVLPSAAGVIVNVSQT